ncbi:hypothetical protein NicSoilB8_07660 [Arthrobacter sp. NicSoilB8]|nr:hypothetical protein NicSoilB8_07660 [Arthrobacter sp. NicSoilB8]
MADGDTGSRPGPSRVRKWSLTKKIVTGLIATAAAIGTLAGAYTVVSNMANWFQHKDDPPSEFEQTPKLGLQFLQDGVQVGMHSADSSDITSIRLKMLTKPFELRFPQPPPHVAVQICGWTDSSVFDLPAQGVRMEDAGCFAPGHGVADYEYASGRMVIAREGMNYLVDNRIIPAGDGKGKTYFSTIVTEPYATVPLTKLKGKTLFLTVVIDYNSDQFISFGEYEYVELDF